MESKILFIAPFENGFIRKDREILASKFRLKSQTLNWKRKTAIPFYFLLQALFVIRHARRAKAILIQFGGMWGVVPAFMGSLLKVPIYVVLHGTDVASLPHYGYGSLRSTLVKKSCAYLYRKAHTLLPVSSSLVEVLNDYNEWDQEQGLRFHFPNLEFRHQVIPNGLSVQEWDPPRQVDREPNRFIAVFNDAQFQLKGGDLILAAANALPHCQFYVAGTNGPKDSGIPENLSFLGKLSQAELKEQFYRATYHLQLSRFEGFGLALCEAMLCSCIPIGSSVNAIPEIIGDTGYILEAHNELKFINLLKDILSTKAPKVGSKAKERILEKYPLSKRREALIDLFEG